MSVDNPTAYSPVAASLQGVELEFVYMAVFSCSWSMNFHAAGSPPFWIQASMLR